VLINSVLCGKKDFSDIFTQKYINKEVVHMCEFILNGNKSNAPIPKDKVRTISKLVGGFGGKEDMNVQHYVALFSFLTN